MLSECFLGMTSQVLLQSKQTFQGALQRTWALLPDLLSAHDRGRHALLTKTDPFLAPTSNTTAVQKTGVPFVPPSKGQKNQRIHRQLEENNLRPRHPQYCFRLQNPIALQTSSVYPCSVKSQPSKCPPYRFRGREPSHQGGHCRNYPHKRGFLQSLVPSPQEGWNFSACDRLKFPEQVCGKLSLPDGKHSLPEVSTSKRRLHDHSGSERCLFVSPSPQGLTKVPTISLEKQMLCLPRPLFWLKYRSKDLHQAFKTRSSISSQTGCSYDPLSGRLSYLGVDLPRGAKSHSHGCNPPGKPRLHYQPGKVMFNSNPNNNLPGLCNRLHRRNTKPSTGESRKGKVPLHEGNPDSNYACPSDSKPSRHSRGMSPSHLASAPSFPTFADQNDPCSTCQQPKLRCESYSGSQPFGRTPLVGVQHRLCERQPNQTSSANVVYNNGCIQDRMGCSLRNSAHKRPLVSQRAHPAHKRIRTEGGLSCPKVLSKEPFPQSGMPENGQHNGSSPCEQQRRYPLSLPLNTHTGTLAVVPGAKHHDISSARTRQVEHHCRLRIEGVQRQQRVEDRLPNDLPLSEGVRNRPVCFSSICPAPQVCQLASGPRGTTGRCTDNGLGTLQGLRPPTFQLDPSSPKQSDSGQSRHHISGTNLASTTMVATTTEPPGQTTSSPPKLQTPPEGPNRPSEDSSNVPQTTLGRVSCLRGQYQAMGIPDNVTEILLSASRSSTRKTYQSAWRRWSGWCIKRKISPLSAPLTDILLYLTEYFNSGAAYRSVNVARSAISTSHPKLNGVPVGQNPLVVQLLKGMFNNRPPKPRYSHTWEVSSVTTYLVSLGSNKSLSLKHLSWKLAMLFSLTCPERVSALTKLDLRHCHILPEGVEFMLPSPRKRGKADQLPKAFFARFPSNSKLCPVETLRCYLKATRTIRPAIPSSKPDPLFISYVKPHKPVTAPSLARWLRSLLKASGVNSDVFKAHSVRGASTTAAANSNVPLSEILKMADWSSPSTFRKFYYKPVHSSTFAHAVLH